MLYLIATEVLKPTYESTNSSPAESTASFNDEQVLQEKTKRHIRRELEEKTRALAQQLAAETKERERLAEVVRDLQEIVKSAHPQSLLKSALETQFDTGRERPDDGMITPTKRQRSYPNLSGHVPSNNSFGRIEREWLTSPVSKSEVEKFSEADPTTEQPKAPCGWIRAGFLWIKGE